MSLGASSEGATRSTLFLAAHAGAARGGGGGEGGVVAPAPPPTLLGLVEGCGAGADGGGPRRAATLELLSRLDSRRRRRSSSNSSSSRSGGGGGGEGGSVLLYYKYAAVGDPQALRQWQVDLCKRLDLRGRVHVGAEGINGTLGGTRTAAALYVHAMRHHRTWGPLFKDTDFKMSATPANGKYAFPNLFVRVCTEICQMNAPPREVRWQDATRHLAPTEFHARLLRAAQGGGPGKDVVLLDVRNMYESAVGRFDGAVRVPTRHFSEFPQVCDALVAKEDLANKEVLMYCTGGIRCERASAYLRARGVTNCYQLRGGIHRYCEAMGSASLFRGRNFVFDRRLTTNRVGTSSAVGKCDFCPRKEGGGRPPQAWDTYDKRLSCAACAALVLVCAQCREDPVFDAVLRGKGRGRVARRGLGAAGEDSASPQVRLLCESCR